MLASAEVFAGGLGTPCGKDDDCRSGHCAEGICCDAACDGSCQTCASSYARPGVCRLAVCDDPTPRCTGETSGVCPATFFCGASGECLTLHAVGDCGTTCSEGTETRRTCKEGSCLRGLYSCGGYQCDGDVCGKSCGDDTDCVANFFCRASRCAPTSEVCGDCEGYPCDPIKRACDRTCSTGQDCQYGDECRNTAAGKHCLFPSGEPAGACGCGLPGFGASAIGLAPFGLCLMFLRRRRGRRGVSKLRRPAS